MKYKLSIAVLFICLVIPLNPTAKKIIPIPPIDADPGLTKKILHGIIKDYYFKTIEKQYGKDAVLIGNKNRGCLLSKKQLKFFYRCRKANAEIFVCGDFNLWRAQHPGWRLTDPDGDGMYTKTVPMAQVSLDHIQFVFIVDKKYIFR